ncbi:MAG: hypothetical protein A2V81_01940 [Candidatus Abawacabacteria bacterium RBG_16_42_10]|uniref:Uncharacterized protein n=1 Tax=Candidatus Abawacabacteria bacterium RBG_16_42_10 TaxID=1817814 RepID=A0A1F4XKP9_9BACT|nr:MAG: hypothetical protein A2V81_01940 [Candidatus Abawacabacteria bacterium RBG_16_42_10]
MAEEKKISWATPIVIGLVVGLTVGILFAKRKGRLLRAELAKAKEENGFSGQILVMKNELVDVMQDLLKTVKNLAQRKEVYRFVRGAKKLSKKALKTVQIIVDNQ